MCTYSTLTGHSQYIENESVYGCWTVGVYLHGICMSNGRTELGILSWMGRSLNFTYKESVCGRNDVWKYVRPVVLLRLTLRLQSVVEPHQCIPYSWTRLHCNGTLCWLVRTVVEGIADTHTKYYRTCVNVLEYRAYECGLFSWWPERILCMVFDVDNPLIYRFW